jgi:hypothetical protein
VFFPSCVSTALEMGGGRWFWWLQKILEIDLYFSFSYSFGSHYLGLESKNSFMILTNTCLAATELVIEFISNSLIFHLMPNLNIYWVPCHFCGFAKMK